MSDYKLYPGAFTIKEADVLRVLKEAAAAGYPPMLYINGMYYDIQLDTDAAPDPGDDELPF